MSDTRLSQARAEARRQLAWCGAMLSRPDCRPGSELWDEVLETISRASRTLTGAMLLDTDDAPGLSLVGQPDPDARAYGLGGRDGMEGMP